MNGFIMGTVVGSSAHDWSSILGMAVGCIILYIISKFM